MLDVIDKGRSSPTTPFRCSSCTDLVRRYTGLLQDESIGVLYRDLVYRDLAEPQRVNAPMVVLGANLDGFFSRAQVGATARAYRTHSEIFPGMGHNMTLEAGWETVAERIDCWLGQHQL